MSLEVIIPNRFPDIIAPLIESIARFEPQASVTIIADGHTNGYGHKVIPYNHPEFVYSKAVNLGIKSVETNIVLLNDDCVLLEPNTFQRLEEVGMSRPEIGLVSPLIKGGVNNEFQRWHLRTICWDRGETLKYIHGVKPICFPCVWIKRTLIDKIGLLDESITGYGGDDNEYCIRTRKSCYRTAITSLVTVQHGTGEVQDVRGKTWNLSFLRRYPKCV